MEDESREALCREKVINIHCMLTLRKQNNKNEKQFDSLPNYFLSILCMEEEGRCFVNNSQILKNLKILKNN